jgi:hypothetical protein
MDTLSAPFKTDLVKIFSLYSLCLLLNLLSYLFPIRIILFFYSYVLIAASQASCARTSPTIMGSGASFSTASPT